MSTTITRQHVLTTMECSSCFIVYAMPQSLYELALGNGRTFYCPNGHSQTYTEHREKVLQRRLEEAERKAVAAKCAALNAEAKAAELEKAATRSSKRLHAGVCPCCNRTFQNLARHMKTKHSKA